MQMNGINELITVAKYWRAWSDPRLIVLVLNNQRPEPGDLGAARDGGRSEVRGSQDSRTSLRRATRSCSGCSGIRVDDAETIARRLGRGARRRPAGRARGRDRSEVPPLPPHITFEQAKDDAEALVKGDPERARRDGAVVQGKLDEFVTSVGGESEPTAQSRSRSSGSTCRAYTIPTDAPESDGTFAWDSTTLVLVEAHARAADRARLHLRGRRRGRAVRVAARRRRRGRATRSTCRPLGGDGARRPQPRPAGRRRRWPSRRSTSRSGT